MNTRKFEVVFQVRATVEIQEKWINEDKKYNDNFKVEEMVESVFHENRNNSDIVTQIDWDMDDCTETKKG
jgi:hypothetical protein